MSHTHGSTRRALAALGPKSTRTHGDRSAPTRPEHKSSEPAWSCRIDGGRVPPRPVSRPAPRADASPRAAGPVEEKASANCKAHERPIADLRSANRRIPASRLQITTERRVPSLCRAPWLAVCLDCTRAYHVCRTPSRPDRGNQRRGPTTTSRSRRRPSSRSASNELAVPTSASSQLLPAASPCSPNLVKGDTTRRSSGCAWATPPSSYTATTCWNTNPNTGADGRRCSTPPVPDTQWQWDRG